jgi:hypothetical protein
MKLSEIKSVISQVLAEAKEAGLPKSGNKLVELKKELASLKKMQESVSQLSLNENDSDTLVAEYIHMQKYVNEYNKIKDSSAKLSEMLGNQISEVENKISAETQKIKEMMGLIEPATKKVEGKKAPKKDDKKKEEPKKVEKKEEPKKVEKKEEIKEGTLNETPIMDFINGVKDLDPAALTALGVSALPVGAALKVIADFIKDKRPTRDKLKDLNKTIAATR